MHVVAAVALSLAVLAAAYQTFLRCARNQRAHFLDRPETRKLIVYQALPTTNAEV